MSINLRKIYFINLFGIKKIILLLRQLLALRDPYNRRLDVLGDQPRKALQLGEDQGQENRQGIPGGQYPSRPQE